MQGHNGLWENSICMVSKRQQIEFRLACSAMINNFSNFHAILHRADQEKQKTTHAKTTSTQMGVSSRLETSEDETDNEMCCFFFCDIIHCSRAPCSELRVTSVVWFIHHQLLRRKKHLNVCPQIQQIIVLTWLVAAFRHFQSFHWSVFKLYFQRKIEKATKGLKSMCYFIIVLLLNILSVSMPT